MDAPIVLLDKNAVDGTTAFARGASESTSLSLAASAHASSASAEAETLPVAGQIKLLGENNQTFSPMNCVQTGEGNLVFLGGDCLYRAKNKLPAASIGGTIRAERIDAPVMGKPGGLSIPVHEFANLLFAPTRNSIIVLDKSGDLFEYDLGRKKWSVLRANVPISGSPDPEFIDFCLSEQNQILNLLDPERNQIWRLKLLPGNAKINATLTPSFAEVMPWRVKAGDASVAECMAIVFDKRFSLLKQFGQLTTIEILSGQKVLQKPLPVLPQNFKLGLIRPSRMLSAADETIPLLIVERQNNRILAVNKTTGRTNAFYFAADANMRGLLPQAAGFWAINGSRMEYRSFDNGANNLKLRPNNMAEKIEPRKNDERLLKLQAPMRGMRLPGHSGVYPGARRLYRYGVHEGLDLFNDRFRVAMNTPVLAAGAGKIVRADSNFQDMNRGTFYRVMSQCVTEHRTSDQNEDLFRGCQVWIDHGNGMVTRYAHLNKINAKLHLGQSVKAGDLIGFVGVSGTGQNLPGRTKYPHLHFEILLDGKYLGYGLTPAETVGIFEDIFESAH